MSTDCPTKLLNDDPAESDAFGSHQRVAQAIATLVTREDGGKAIALTGTWGSGKSTVVSLLRSTLSNTETGSIPETAVFVYDAWVHQGDPLRRSFLETFIAFLADRGWTKRTNWEDDLESISRRREKTDTTSEPILTWPGRLLVLSALLVPLGYMLFGSGVHGGIGTIFGIPFWLLGLILLLSPLLAGVLTYVVWRPLIWPWKWEFWTTHRAPHENDSIVSLFIQKTREVVTSKTVRTADPTSLEFQGIFHRSLADSLKDSNRRLVVVMDNLDRVPPHEALTIWSTMRAFFDVDRLAQITWLPRFWLLVPFDRTALERLWAYKPEGEGGGAEKTKNNNTDQLVDAFADKSFQVEFRVAPPVLSAWKKFLLDQLAQAFPEHQPREELYTVYRIFRLQGLPPKRPLAPRDVKVFINKVGSLHRQWSDQVPLPMQALYVLWAREIKNPQEDLIKDDFLGPKVLNLISQYEWRKYLAALYFNVEPDKAYEVLIGKTVEEALSNADSEAFSKLQSIPGLVTVCDYVLEENCYDWAAKEPGALATSAIVLDAAGTDGEPWRPCWQWLIRGISRLDKWTGLNEQHGNGIVTILRHANGTDMEALARVILKAVRGDTKATEAKEKAPEAQAVTDWVDGTLAVVNYLHEQGHGEVIKKEFRVPGAPASYLQAVGHLRQKLIGEGIAAYFLPEGQPKEIIDGLSRICQGGEFSDQQRAAVDMMLKIQQTWPWQGLVSAISQRLQASNTTKPEELKACLWSVLVLNRHSVAQARQTLDALCKQGHLMHHLHGVQNEPNLAGLVVLAHLIVLPDGNIQGAPANANTGKQFYQNLLSNPGGSPEVAKQLGAISIELGMPEVPVTAFKQVGQTKALASEILRQTLSRDDVEHHLPSEYLLKEYEAISQLLDDPSLERLTNALVERGNLVSQLSGADFSVTYEKLYAFAYETSDAENRQKLRTAIMPALRSLDKAPWLEQLEREGYLLQFLVSVINDEPKLNLGEGFHDALLDHAQKVIAGAKVPTKFVDKWALMPRILDNDWQRTFSSNLWDEFNAASNKSLKNFLMLYGQFLLDSEVPSNICDTIVRQGLPPMLGRNVPEELAWVADLFDGKSGFFRQAQKYNQDTFKKRIETKLQDCDDESLRANIERIARAVGVSPEAIYAEKTQEEEPPEGAKEE